MLAFGDHWRDVAPPEQLKALERLLRSNARSTDGADRDRALRQRRAYAATLSRWAVEHA